MEGDERVEQYLRDELIIDAKKVSLIENNKERLEQCYRVKVEYGLRATDDVTPKQWIIIEGQPEDRTYAKNYVRALCNAEEKMCIQYPVELHSILTNPKIHTRLERQSQTAIMFDPGRVGEACISGMDTLAVTLAFSAVEDIITKYSEDGDGDAILESPIAKLASSRLDTELQRLHSQDKEILCDDDYSKMPDAVKRSILNWYLEDATNEDTTTQSAVKTDGKTTAVYKTDSVDQVTDRLENTQLTWGSARKKAVSESDPADIVGYLAKPSDFVASSPSDSSLPPASLPQENSLLRDTGRSHGYTDDEINIVLISAQGPMRTSEFIKALVGNRKMEAKASQSASDLHDRKQTGVATSGLVSDGGGKHPMDEFFFNGSPKTKSKQPHSQSPKLLSESTNQQNFMDYFAKLSQDFEEEGGEVPLEELKRRSRERQKLLRDALLKPKEETESEEAVEVAASDDEDEENGDIAESENPDNPDGWVKAGAKPKKRRNKKKRNNQSALLNSVQQDRNKTPSEQNFTHHFSSSPTKQQEFTGFKQPNSPKKRPGNQNQQRLPSHSPVGKHAVGGQRFHNENRSPSPSKSRSPRNPAQNQGASNAFTFQTDTPMQQEFNALRQQFTNPFKGYQAPSGQQQTTSIFGASAASSNSHQQQQFTRSIPVQPQQKPVVKGRKDLRYIIIDGSNLAMGHGNHQIFSCRGIELCVNHFLQRGHTQITAFVPQWRSRTNLAPGYEVYDQHILEELREKGYLVYTPARRVPGKNIVCYDDRFVIRLAKETDGIIVSNDNYRDLWDQHRDWRTVIEERLLMYTFVGDIFMLPDDPLGRYGPTLDNFLQKTDLLNTVQSTGGQPMQHAQQRPRPVGQGRFPDRNQQVGQNAWNRAPPPPQTHQTNYMPHGYQPFGANQKHGQQNKGTVQQRQQQPNRNVGQQQRVQQAAQFTGASEANNPQPLRTKEITNWLAANLQKVFPGDGDKIHRILENHPFETDMNKLSTYILEVL